MSLYKKGDIELIGSVPASRSSARKLTPPLILPQNIG